MLELVAADLGNHKIARRLVLSKKTIRNHVPGILVTLQVPDRASAVAKARDAGLGTNFRTRRSLDRHTRLGEHRLVWLCWPTAPNS